MAILDFLPSSLKSWLACAVLAAGACVWGYTHGAKLTRLDYEARLAALQTTYAEQERVRAEAAAAAEKSARERLAAELERGNRLAAELDARTRELDTVRADLNKRIRHVSETARRDCPGLSADWVRLYNEALGLGAGDHAGSEGSASGSTPDASSSAGTAGAGVQPDALATPEDVLAHIRDYGQYCRRLEAAYRALIAYEKGKP